MAEEAKSISWLKVFGGVGLSGVLRGVESRVKVGTKYQYRCEKTVYPQITCVTSDTLDDNYK